MAEDINYSKRHVHVDGDLRSPGNIRSTVTFFHLVLYSLCSPLSAFVFSVLRRLGSLLRCSHRMELKFICALLNSLTLKVQTLY